MDEQVSLFHTIQRDGAKALRVEGFRKNIKVSLDPFVRKVVPTFHDPFVVYQISEKDFLGIQRRMEQVFASWGTDLSSLDDQNDRDAARGLIQEELQKSRLPSRRFGLEIVREDGQIVAFLFEAIKELKKYFDVTKGELPVVYYAAEECRDRSLAECNIIRGYVLTADNAAVDPSEKMKVTLNTDCLTQFTGSARAGCGANLGKLWMKTDFLPMVTREMALEWAKDLTSIEGNIFEDADASHGILAKSTWSLLTRSFTLLWLLEREPEFLDSGVNKFEEQNRKQKRLGRNGLSPINTIRINQETLRRVELERSEEIQHALINHGGYSIPGLVLVAEHTKPSSNTNVEAYARCPSNEEVRLKATELLRAKNFDQLAILVAEFGHQTTKEAFSISKLNIIKTVDRSQVERPAVSPLFPRAQL